ncbi:MAG: DUF5615 family PIN-like protein [Chloroflexi bacterium]|nr:DUF5615 family PIN-like protein [Chloroflexota bacterium]MBI5080392.1 DUF5615 family PIN-like protein [Chloroflexota bacterium]
MRVLLDECLPKKLKHEFTGHEVKTVPEMGWAGKKNGELMRLAVGQFDAFVTADQNIQYQQNLKVSEIAVIFLVAVDNRFETLKPLIPQVEEKLREIKNGDVIRVSE